MRRLLKIIFWTIGTLVGLIIAAVIAVPLLIDVNDYRPQMAQAVTDATGREMKIDGELELSVFPWLGVNTGAIELGNRKGFGKKAFAKIDSAQIRIKLLPLLSQQYEVDTLVFKGLSLNLQRRKNGTDNWSDLAKANGKPAKKDSKSPDAKDIGALAVIGGVNLESATLVFEDKQAGQTIKVNKLNLTTGALKIGEPMALNFNTEFSASAQKVAGKMSLDTIISANPFAGSFAMRDMRLDINAKGKDLPGGKVKALLRADVEGNLINQVLNIDRLNLQSDPLNVTGDMAVTQFRSSKPKLNGAIKVAGFDPKELFKKLNIKPPVTADPTALSQASLETRISGNPQNLNFSGLKLIIDNTLMSGKATVRNSKRLFASFDLKLDRIDIDRYLAPAPEKTSQGFSLISTAHAAPKPAPLIPTELLRSLDLKGKINAGSLTASRLLIENADVNINLKRGVLKLDPISGNTYGGKYNGHIKVDASKKQGNKPLISLNESLQGVQIGPVLKTMTGTEHMTGQGNVTAKLTARGQSIDALRSSLNGEVKLNVTNGVVKGLNYIQSLRETLAKFRNQTTATQQAPQQTEFTGLRMSLQARNGLLSTQDLVLESIFPVIKGKGNVNLINENIDFQVKTKLTDSLLQEIGFNQMQYNGIKIEREQIAGTPVRVNIKGNMLSPDVSLDWQKIVGRIAEKAVKKAAEKKVKKALEKKLGDKLGDGLLNKLFGGKSKKSKPAPITAPPPVTAPAPAPETSAQRKAREKKEKEDKLKKLFGF